MPQVSTVLGYKDVFGTSCEKTILEVINGISPELLLLTICKTSALLFDGKKSIEILDLFTSTATKNIYKTDYSKIVLKLKLSKQNEIFNEKSNLNLLRTIIENYSLLENNKLPNNYPLIEINLFKAYLILNELTYDSTNGSPFEEIDREHFFEFSQIILLKKTIQFQSKNDFLHEFLKIKCLLNYYYQQEKDILKTFYLKNSITNPDLWILEILKLLTLHDDNNNYRFSIDENHWISKYCENTTVNQFFDKKTSINQLKLNSLYYNNNQYTIINWSFFLQHLFYRIYYELFLLYKAKYPYISNFAQYKSIASKDGSEKILFRTAILNSFQHKSIFIKFEEGIRGFPDCYIRHNNTIFIFEFKDNAISEDFIDIDDYSFIKTYIDDRFIQNSARQNKPKGITQLANFITALESHQDIDKNLFDNYRISSIDIYPIIVVTDEMFSIPAIEFYLRKEMKKLNIQHNFRSIKDLIIINISTLTKYFLGADKPNYIKVIKEYSSRRKTFKEKDIFPKYPNIESIKYNKHSKTKTFIDLLSELIICDIPLEQQFQNAKNEGLKN